MTEQIQRHLGPSQRGSQALTEALHLQQAVRDRAAIPQPRHARRAKGEDVVDLDARTITRSRRHTALLVTLWVEATIAAVLVAVLVAYLVMEGDRLQ